MSVLCPGCHRPFTTQIVKREVMGDELHKAEPFTGTRSRPFSVDVSKAVVEYRHYCICRYCEYEWTETRVVKFNA